MQLVGHITIVDVDGYGANLERRQHRLDELGAIEEIQADVVAGSDAAIREGMRQTRRPLIELAERQPVIAADERLRSPIASTTLSNRSAMLNCMIRVTESPRNTGAIRD